ncbi:MAG TPA: hypothetical protein DDW76_24255 [Cyanobacteria bacterium UBA11369]|nr:hypothetical protein [Cyanobacteria bacterium UBA11369]
MNGIAAFIRIFSNAISGSINDVSIVAQTADQAIITARSIEDVIKLVTCNRVVKFVTSTILGSANQGQVFYIGS